MCFFSNLSSKHQSTVDLHLSWLSVFCHAMEIGESEGAESGPNTSTCHYDSSVMEEMPQEDMEFIKSEEQINEMASIVLPKDAAPGTESGEGFEASIDSITYYPSAHTLHSKRIMSGVKVKPINTLQARINYEGPKHKKDGEEDQNNKNNQNSVKISVKTLMTTIQRLEKVSNKLTSTVLEDSYEQFGRYISSVLRGLPLKKVTVLKKKIMSDVMDILVQEQPLSKMNPPKSVPQKTKADANYRVVSEQRTPSVLQISEHAGILHYPQVFAPQTSIIVGDAVTVNTPPSFIAGESTETAPESMDESLMGTMTPNSILSALLESNQSPSMSPRGQKRRKTINKVGRSQSDAQSDSSSKDEANRDDQAMSSRMETSDKSFEIDIEEGHELIKKKEDQYSFETVLCGENSNLYIKEEVPDAPSSPSASTYACHTCPARFYSESELSTHLSTSHPGPPEKKPRCGYCPLRKNRFTQRKCSECNNPICKEHTGSTRLVCVECTQQPAEIEDEAMD